MGNFEFGGNRLIGLCEIRAIVDQLSNQRRAVRSHPVDQRLREKAWGLRNSKLDMRAARILDSTQEGAIFVSGKILVELLTQERNHQKRRSARL